MNQKTNYFLDTFALIEIAKGNEKFKKFLDEELFTSLFNLYEFYFVLLRDFNEQIAREFFYQFRTRIIQIRDEHIFKASRFKLDNRKKKLSYVDCLGYIIALEYGLKFLTGDREFKELNNVEFIEN